MLRGSKPGYPIQTMRICLTLAVTLLTFLLSGCRHSGGGSRQSETAGSSDSISEMSPAYALGFSVSERPDGVRLVTMRHPADTNAVPQHFALIPKGILKKADIFIPDFKIQPTIT